MHHHCHHLHICGTLITQKNYAELRKLLAFEPVYLNSLSSTYLSKIHWLFALISTYLPAAAV